MNPYKITRYSKPIAILVLFITLFTINQGHAQLTVSTSMTPQQLVQNVLIGSGVTVSNVTYNGFAQAIGHFTTGSSPTNLGISEGIIMSTGVVDGSNGQPAIGSPASDITNINASNENGTGSDPQLAAIVAPDVVKDAAVLEFDFIPLSDTIKFKYVFASEEYPEYVNAYNDVFGFFISGPNPLGGNYSNKNIALIPGTSTPISIDNVNNGTWNTGPCMNCSYYVNNEYGMTIVYDGFTTVLTAWCKVTPCQTYHLKLAIGDVVDAAYDSAVFLEANSFSSNAVDVSATYTSAGDTTAIEGCSNAIVSFTLAQPATSPYTINYTVGGTAASGADYTPIPNSVTIPTGQDSAAIVIIPILDGITEGTETVILTVQTSACGSTQVVTIYIRDNTQLVVTAIGDTTICGGQATLSAMASGGIPGYTYQWSGGVGNTSTVVVSPAISTTYVVTVMDACGSSSTADVTVTIGSGFAEAGNDTTICQGGTATLMAIGGSGYHWSNNVNTAINPVSPTQTTLYYVTVSGSCDGYDSVKVFVNPAPAITATATPDSICLGENTTLLAGGGISYLWTSNPADSSLAGNETSPSPLVQPDQTTVYTVTGVGNNFCTNTAATTVYIKPNPVASFTINPSIVCIGQNVTITFNGSATSGANFTWDFGGGTFTGSGQGPYQVSWSTTGSKAIALSILDNGCPSNIANDTLTVNSGPISNFSATSTFGCTPLTVFFYDSSQNVNFSTIYQWQFGDGNSSALQNPAHTYTTSGIYDVTLTVINGSNCRDSYTIQSLVNAYPAPSADFRVYPPIVSIFDPVVYFNDESSGSSPIASWEWDLGNGDTKNVPDFVYTYSDTGKYIVKLTVYNQYGCVDSAYSSVIVRPDYTIYIPNAFTPNGNALNDVYKVYGTGILAFNIKIFDRWGKMVYNSSDMEAGWDGKYKGQKAQQGVYSYSVYYKNSLKKEYIVYGTITLL